MKIAQLLILPYKEMKPKRVKNLSIVSERGAAGFGSSGITSSDTAVHFSVPESRIRLPTKVENTVPWWRKDRRDTVQCILHLLSFTCIILLVLWILMLVPMTSSISIRSTMINGFHKIHKRNLASQGIRRAQLLCDNFKGWVKRMKEVHNSEINNQTHPSLFANMAHICQWAKNAKMMAERFGLTKNGKPTEKMFKLYKEEQMELNWFSSILGKDFLGIESFINTIGYHIK
ncbi:MAG: hypothetical protein GY816_01885, partial [Cytophagales bacterium]|nr:hypothetical protein [Cytophagales bacterium]